MIQSPNLYCNAVFNNVVIISIVTSNKERHFRYPGVGNESIGSVQFVTPHWHGRISKEKK